MGWTGIPLRHLHRPAGDTGVQQVDQDGAEVVAADQADDVSNETRIKPWDSELCLLDLAINIKNTLIRYTPRRLLCNLVMFTYSKGQFRSRFKENTNGSKIDIVS